MSRKLSKMRSSIHSFFPILLTTLLLINPPSSAFPLPASTTTNRWVGIYMCTEPNYRGSCHWHHLEPEDRESEGKCLHVEVPGDKRIASFGPDWGIGVNLYRDPDCQSMVTGPMVCPGFPNMIGWWDVTKPKTDLFVRAKNIPPEMQASEGMGGDVRASLSGLCECRYYREVRDAEGVGLRRGAREDRSSKSSSHDVSTRVSRVECEMINQCRTQSHSKSRV